MERHQSETVVGRLPVLACLQARRRPAKKLYIYKSARDVDEIAATAGHIPIEYVDRQRLDALANGVVHQGIVLRADPLPLFCLEEWLETLAETRLSLIILDSIEDPQNFGAIARSAAACGASGLIFAKDRSSPITPAAMKAAAGAMEYIPLIQETNLVRAMQRLKQADFWLAALEAQAPQTLWEARLDGRIGFVIGNEGVGIRRLVREQADFGLSIPIQGPVTSLNASVSAAMVLGEWLRQKAQAHSGAAIP